MNAPLTFEMVREATTTPRQPNRKERRAHATLEAPAPDNATYGARWVSNPINSVRNTRRKMNRYDKWVRKIVGEAQ